MEATLNQVAMPQRKVAVYVGRVLSGLAIVALALDGAMKLVKPREVIEGTLQLGYPVTVITALGVVLLSCVALYAVPWTAVLGAILLTGYLGGAVASHVRVGDPLFSHVLFPIYVGVFIWGGLFLRSARLRAAIFGD